MKIICSSIEKEMSAIKYIQFIGGLNEEQNKFDIIGYLNKYKCCFISSQMRFKFIKKQIAHKIRKFVLYRMIFCQGLPKIEKIE